jgi:hypothetical protein
MRTGEKSEGWQTERAAGLHIRELLARPGSYRERWEAEGQGTGPAEVSQAAVCRVLARHLWETGEQPETDTDLPRVLEDPVSRALRGVGLSLWLLNMFTAAFRFSDDDRENLAALYRGRRRQRPSAVVGTLPPPDQVPGYRTPEFDTLELREHHWLGPDGLPIRHRTAAIIRSRVDGLDRYQYRMDTPHAKVNTISGGRKTEMYEAGGGIWAIDLVFPRPLRLAEVHYIEFWTLLRYYRKPPGEMRRGSHERIRHLDISVSFHRDKRPSAVWWAEWAHYTGPDNKIIYREPYELDDQLSVHRHVDVVERAVVGFCWDWCGPAE